MYFDFILGLITLASYLVLAAGLVYKYIRTRDIGFVWLGGAVVIWPVISGLLIQAIERRVFRGPPIKLYPFTLVGHRQMSIGSLITSLYSLQHLIEIGLLLVAILYLCRAKPDDTRTIT